MATTEQTALEGLFDQFDYDAYGGVEQVGFSTGLPYRFRGMRFDPETSFLVLGGGRFYDPGLGRAISRVMGFLPATLLNPYVGNLLFGLLSKPGVEPAPRPFDSDYPWERGSDCKPEKIEYRASGQMSLPLQQKIDARDLADGKKLMSPFKRRLGAVFGNVRNRSSSPWGYVGFAFETVYHLTPGSDWRLCTYRQRVKGVVNASGSRWVYGNPGATPGGVPKATELTQDPEGRVWDFKPTWRGNVGSVFGDDLRNKLPYNMKRETATRVVFWDRPRADQGFVLSFESSVVGSDGGAVYDHVLLGASRRNLAKKVLWVPHYRGFASSSVVAEFVEP